MLVMGQQLREVIQGHKNKVQTGPHLCPGMVKLMSKNRIQDPTDSL